MEKKASNPTPCIPDLVFCRRLSLYGHHFMLCASQIVMLVTFNLTYTVLSINYISTKLEEKIKIYENHF